MASTSYLTSSEFLSQTNITFDATLIDSALSYAKNEIKRTFFSKKVYLSNASNTTHYLIANSTQTPYLNYYIADITGDLTVDKNDLNAYELSTTLTETDRNSTISSLNSKYGVLVFSTALPTSTNQLRVEYYAMKYEMSVMSEPLKRLSKLYAIKWLFENVPFEKLQKGISSWTLNGVTVSFDLDAMKKVSEDINKQIYTLHMQYGLLHTALTKGQTNADASIFKFKNSITFV